jgi:hypothetical protein
VPDSSEKPPDLLARALATTIVSVGMGLVVGKVFGKRAAFIAVLATVLAHEVVDAPLAQQLSKLGI